jgi:hypothetical protein
MAAYGLVVEIGLEDPLVLGGQRGLLSEAVGLGRVE